MNYVTRVVAFITKSLDPRLDEFLGFDVPAKYTNIVTTAVVMWAYCTFIH